MCPMDVLGIFMHTSYKQNMIYDSIYFSKYLIYNYIIYIYRYYIYIYYTYEIPILFYTIRLFDPPSTASPVSLAPPSKRPAPHQRPRRQGWPAPCYAELEGLVGGNLHSKRGFKAWISLKIQGTSPKRLVHISLSSCHSNWQKCGAIHHFQTKPYVKCMLNRCWNMK